MSRHPNENPAAGDTAAGRYHVVIVGRRSIVRSADTSQAADLVQGEPKIIDSVGVDIYYIGGIRVRRPAHALSIGRGHELILVEPHQRVLEPFAIGFMPKGRAEIASLV